MRRCPLCRGGEIMQVLAVPKAPLQIGIAWPSRAEARDAPVADTVLMVCATCGFLFNAAFDTERVRYGYGYDVVLTHSETYRAYLEAEARRLVDEHDIRERRVLEIGCGDGYFLRLLCQMGSNIGLGLDPSLPVDRIEPGLTLLAREFEPGHGIFDLVVVRSVLELIPNPVAFLHDIRSALGPGALCYLEVPNAAWVLHHGMAWNVHHEHCSSFTVDTLRRVCEAAGLILLDVGPCYVDDQYLRAVATRSARPQIVEAAEKFGAAYAVAVASWTHRLAATRRAGGRIVVWGAGGRGASFLAAADPGDELVDAVVDVNPARQGAFLPVTGHAIRSPNDVELATATAILVTNATYLTEITQAARGLGFEGELWTL